jgi:transcriptional regulator of aromatic amino acid metabolism
MRRWILSAALGLATLSNVGCIINQYSSDPNERMQEMLNESENLRQIREEWRRFWMLDQPSHLTPVRIHGGVGP